MATKSRRKASPFGRHLRALRERAGVSPEELGRRCEVHAQILRKLETGQSQWPRLDTAKKIADALGLTLSDLWP